MKRIDVIYGGHAYSIGRAEFEAVQAEVTTGLASGSHWLRVNEGEGSEREAFLLITPGASLALIPLPDGETAPPEETGKWTVQPASTSP
jgi:hypothetical protein